MCVCVFVCELWYPQMASFATDKENESWDLGVPIFTQSHMAYICIQKKYLLDGWETRSSSLAPIE